MNEKTPAAQQYRGMKSSEDTSHLPVTEAVKPVKENMTVAPATPPPQQVQPQQQAQQPPPELTAENWGKTKTGSQLWYESQQNTPNEASLRWLENIHKQTFYDGGELLGGLVGWVPEVFDMDATNHRYEKEMYNTSWKMVHAEDAESKEIFFNEYMELNDKIARDFNSMRKNKQIELLWEIPVKMPATFAWQTTMDMASYARWSAINGTTGLTEKEFDEHLKKYSENPVGLVLASALTFSMIKHGAGKIKKWVNPKKKVNTEFTPEMEAEVEKLKAEKGSEAPPPPPDDGGGGGGGVRIEPEKFAEAPVEINPEKLNDTGLGEIYKTKHEEYKNWKEAVGEEYKIKKAYAEIKNGGTNEITVELKDTKPITLKPEVYDEMYRNSVEKGPEILKDIKETVGPEQAKPAYVNYFGEVLNFSKAAYEKIKASPEGKTVAESLNNLIGQGKNLYASLKKSKAGAGILTAVEGWNDRIFKKINEFNDKIVNSNNETFVLARNIINDRKAIFAKAVSAFDKTIAFVKSKLNIDNIKAMNIREEVIKEPVVIKTKDTMFGVEIPPEVTEVVKKSSPTRQRIEAETIENLKNASSTDIFMLREELNKTLTELDSESKTRPFNETEKAIHETLRQAADVTEKETNRRKTEGKHYGKRGASGPGGKTPEPEQPPPTKPPEPKKTTSGSEESPKRTDTGKTENFKKVVEDKLKRLGYSETDINKMTRENVSKIIDEEIEKQSAPTVIKKPDLKEVEQIKIRESEIPFEVEMPEKEIENFLKTSWKKQYKALYDIKSENPATKANAEKILKDMYEVKRQQKLGTRYAYKNYDEFINEQLTYAEREIRHDLARNMVRTDTIWETENKANRDEILFARRKFVTADYKRYLNWKSLGFADELYMKKLKPLIEEAERNPDFEFYEGEKDYLEAKASETKDLTKYTDRNLTLDYKGDRWVKTEEYEYAPEAKSRRVYEKEIWETTERAEREKDLRHSNEIAEDFINEKYGTAKPHLKKGDYSIEELENPMSEAYGLPPYLEKIKKDIAAKLKHDGWIHEEYKIAIGGGKFAPDTLKVDMVHPSAGRRNVFSRPKYVILTKDNIRLELTEDYIKSVKGDKIIEGKHKGYSKTGEIVELPGDKVEANINGEKIIAEVEEVMWEEKLDRDPMTPWEKGIPVLREPYPTHKGVIHDVVYMAKDGKRRYVQVEEVWTQKANKPESRARMPVIKLTNENKKLTTGMVEVTPELIKKYPETKKYAMPEGKVMINKNSIPGYVKEVISPETEFIQGFTGTDLATGKKISGTRANVISKVKGMGIKDVTPGQAVQWYGTQYTILNKKSPTPGFVAGRDFNGNQKWLPLRQLREIPRSGKPVDYLNPLLDPAELDKIPPVGFKTKSVVEEPIKQVKSASPTSQLPKVGTKEYYKSIKKTPEPLFKKQKDISEAEYLKKKGEITQESLKEQERLIKEEFTKQNKSAFAKMNRVAAIKRMQARAKFASEGRNVGAAANPKMNVFIKGREFYSVEEVAKALFTKEIHPIETLVALKNANYKYWTDLINPKRMRLLTNAGEAFQIPETEQFAHEVIAGRVHGEITRSIIQKNIFEKAFSKEEISKIIDDYETDKYEYTYKADQAKLKGAERVARWIYDTVEPMWQLMPEGSKKLGYIKNYFPHWTEEGARKSMMIKSMPENELVAGNTPQDYVGEAIHSMFERHREGGGKYTKTLDVPLMYKSLLTENALSNNIIRYIEDVKTSIKTNIEAARINSEKLRKNLEEIKEKYKNVEESNEGVHDELDMKILEIEKELQDPKYNVLDWENMYKDAENYQGSIKRRTGILDKKLFNYLDKNDGAMKYWIDKLSKLHIGNFQFRNPELIKIKGKNWIRADVLDEAGNSWKHGKLFTPEQLLSEAPITGFIDKYRSVQYASVLGLNIPAALNNLSAVFTAMVVMPFNFKSLGNIWSAMKGSFKIRSKADIANLQDMGILEGSEIWNMVERYTPSKEMGIIRRTINFVMKPFREIEYASREMSQKMLEKTLPESMEASERAYEAAKASKATQLSYGDWQTEQMFTDSLGRGLTTFTEYPIKFGKLLWRMLTNKRGDPTIDSFLNHINQGKEPKYWFEKANNRQKVIVAKWLLLTIGVSTALVAVTNRKQLQQDPRKTFSISPARSLLVYRPYEFMSKIAKGDIVGAGNVVSKTLVPGRVGAEASKRFITGD